MKTYTKEQLSGILENHKLWLNNDGGSRANLRDADMRDADLSYANLRDANLSGANLRYANLSYANLSGANLRGANLFGADLSDANLRDANLSYADLRYANLRDADMRDADLSYANLSGTSGNMSELKSIFIETYPVTYTSEILQIGCQKHKIEDWWEFDDEKIISMDGKKALKFWRKCKGFIKTAIELSPANPTKQD